MRLTFIPPPCTCPAQLQVKLRWRTCRASLADRPCALGRTAINTLEGQRGCQLGYDMVHITHQKSYTRLLLRTEKLPWKNNEQRRCRRAPCHVGGQREGSAVRSYRSIFARLAACWHIFVTEAILFDSIEPKSCGVKTGLVNVKCKNHRTELGPASRCKAHDRPHQHCKVAELAQIR
jgi:hypothetical protein